MSTQSRKPRAKSTPVSTAGVKKPTTSRRVNKTKKGDEFIEVLPGDTVWRIASRSVSKSNTVLNFDMITEEKKRLEALNPNVSELIPGMLLRRW